MISTHQMIIGGKPRFVEIGIRIMPPDDEDEIPVGLNYALAWHAREALGSPQPDTPAWDEALA